MRITAAGASDIGRVRDANDDCYCLGTTVGREALQVMALDTDAAGFAQHGLLLAVADGMGGYAGGGTASRTALEALAELYHAGGAGPGATARAQWLRDCLAQVQQRLAAVLRGDTALALAGTTLAGIVLTPPDELCVFHAGDSRVLRFAGGEHGFLRQLTADHTPLGQAMFAGEISEADAARQPQYGRLTRALGLVGETQVQVECGLKWEAGDMFLLCTDGFHGTGRGLPKALLQDALRACGELDPCVPALLRQAVELDGADNATLVLARIDEGQHVS